MDRVEVRALLDGVAAGRLPVEQALRRLVEGPLAGDGALDLGFARVDAHRGLRTGDPEVVYAAGKTTEQVVAVVRALIEVGGERPVLVTRAGPEHAGALRALPARITADPGERTLALGPLPPGRGQVLVVAAGTSDGPVAAEAALTAAAFGAHVERIDDVGVAGLHRLLAVRDRLDRADCLIVVAGMEGALPSVVGGLVGAPVVAVPTSVGYGVAAGGFAALLGMLTSCAPGVAVCNVDNGFGAGVFAARVARAAAGAGFARVEREAGEAAP